MYESENTSYLDVILGSKSISDFISSYYLIEEVTSYDMDLLELVEEERNQIAEKQSQIETQRKELETKKNTEQRTQISLSNTRLLRQNYLSKLSQEEQNLQAQIDEYNKQVNEIESEIKKLAYIMV